MVKVISFESFKDASGAPAVLEVSGARFAFDCLGEVKCNCIRPISGLAVRSAARRAAADATRKYLQLLAGLGEEWRDRNQEMYKDV